MTPFIENFEPLAHDYDVLLCDVWGVIHNGVAAFPAACDALLRFRDRGGTAILITNAPRSGEAVARILDRLGVSRDAYAAITSSGDVTRGIVSSRLPQAVFHLGPERDLSIFAGLDVTFAKLETADYVVCSGLFDDTTETPESYRDMLTAMRERSLFMVCANPDVVVERGDTLVYCAGALADAYKALGGEVLYCGKPHAPIYEVALEKAAALRGGIAPASPPRAGDRRFGADRSEGRRRFRARLYVRDLRPSCRGLRFARGAGHGGAQRDLRRRGSGAESGDAGAELVRLR